MASFYGPGSSGGSGGGAVITSYNSLLNVPIVNQNGSQMNPIKISDLDYGNYSLTGFYTDDNSRVVQLEAPLMVSVGVDEQTGDKVAYYHTIVGGQMILTTVTDRNGNIIVNKTLMGGAGSSEVAEIANTVALSFF